MPTQIWDGISSVAFMWFLQPPLDIFAVIRCSRYAHVFLYLFIGQWAISCYCCNFLSFTFSNSIHSLIHIHIQMGHIYSLPQLLEIRNENTVTFHPKNEYSNFLCPSFYSSMCCCYLIISCILIQRRNWYLPGRKKSALGTQAISCDILFIFTYLKVYLHSERQRYMPETSQYFTFSFFIFVILIPLVWNTTFSAE